MPEASFGAVSSDLFQVALHRTPSEGEERKEQVTGAERERGDSPSMLRESAVLCCSAQAFVQQQASVQQEASTCRHSRLLF